MLVDVIVPTKDRPLLTSEAVRSVLAQTHASFRVLVVDDGSGAAALDELQALTESDSRISLICRSESGGPQAARQTGLEHATAEAIALVDSDDYWKPAKLDAQVRFMVSNPEFGAVLTWHAWETDGEVSLIRKPISSAKPNPLLTDNMSSPLFRREALGDAGGFLPSNIRSPLRGSEHIEFWIRLLQFCQVGVVESVLTVCREHSGRRESDQLANRQAAESLAYVLNTHERYVKEFPEDHARLLARTGARFLESGSTGEGLDFLLQAFRVAPSHSDRLRLLRRYGPYSLKRLLSNARNSQQSQPTEGP